MVVEEEVVAVVLTEVVVVEEDLEGVEVAEEDLTETKTMAHQNMLSLWESLCTPVRMILSVNV